MPRLAAGALGPGSERWPRRVIRPTGIPLRELATQLAELAVRTVTGRGCSRWGR
jgi:hypothetical protein